MFLAQFVCLFFLAVCLFVSKDYVKTTRPIFMKLGFKGVALAKEEPITFWSIFKSQGRPTNNFFTFVNIARWGIWPGRWGCTL